MPTLPVGERDSIAYEDTGRGPLVVLIHGSPGSGRAGQATAKPPNSLSTMRRTKTTTPVPAIASTRRS